MQEVDIWQSLAENAQSCIMTISKDKGNGKTSAKSFNLFFAMQTTNHKKILVISLIYC